MYIKHEHIPTISASEIAVWKQCKQKWYWQYFMRVEPSVTHTKLAQGTMAHAGIAAALAGDNVRAAVAKSAAELSRTVALSIGEEDLDSASLLAEAEAEIDLVAGCVKKWDHESSYRQSGRKLIDSEAAWTMPIRDGSRNSMPDVTWNGRIDAFIAVPFSPNSVWGLEAKFVGQFRTPESVELSSQLAMYLMYMQHRGIENPKLLYLQILNRLPAIPNVNKTGGISRSAITTDWETYKAAVVANGYDPEDYADMREKLAPRRFWTEQVISRPVERLIEDRASLYDCSIELMAKRKRIYMCDSPFLCKSCQFRDLCLETVRGRDPQNLIDAGAYVPRDKPQDDAEVEADAQN